MAGEMNVLLYVSLQQCGEIRLRLKGLFWLIGVLMQGGGMYRPLIGNSLNRILFFAVASNDTLPS